MKTWDAFYPDVLPFVPVGTPDPTVDRQLMRAAQAFMHRTRAWLVQLTPVTTLDATLEYTMPIDAGAQLVRLESATLDGEDYSVWRPEGRSACDRSCYVYTDNGYSIKFNDQPAVGSALVLTCTVEPSEAATGVDDNIFRLYALTIARGAIGALGKDAVAQLQFENDCNRINHEIWRGRAKTRPRSVGFQF